MHTSMFIWKPHPGKLKEMREIVITIRDHCRRIGGANEVNCAALQGSFFGHFAVAMRCENGIDTEKAIALIVNGFSKEVLNKLPMEFAVEAQKLLEISLEGSVG